MNVMLCFEVSDKHEQVRKELASKGYMSSWKVKRGRDEITFHLPSGAMWNKGEHVSPTSTKEDLKTIASKMNVKVVRAVALVVSKWDGMTGTPVDSGRSEHASAQMETTEDSSS